MGILSTILGSGDVIGKGLDLIDSMHTSKAEEIDQISEFENLAFTLKSS